ncbi:MAG: InlB B-repeat-containing protein, partial [Bacteroidales bacterium]|nr:InlB B-repeat-containing protein [Bacteroidales bacterium]
MKNTKKTFLGVIMAVVMVFAFAAALIMPTTLTAHAETREREIVAVDSGNSLHMNINDEGLLTWDTVANATGYGVSVMQNSATVAIFDTTNKALMIVTELDSLKLDSGRYVIEVYAKGVAKRASMSYYYTSNVDKLESPHGLQWIGNKAGWENVEGATSYRLWLYGFSGEEFSIVTNDNPYDLSAYSPQDGWTFKVQALGNGTLASKRDSAVVESPAKGSRTRTINAANSGNALNMAITNEELLTWDAVENATGYRIAVKRNNLEVTFFETTYNFIALLSSLDGAKLASGQYVLEVAPQGVAANSASMSYYYTSNVDQLESPYNLHWNGTQACWTAVAGATLYDVTLYDFNGAVVTVPTEDDYYDFEGNSPEDGWTFKVQARSNGTLNAPRHSISQESPAKETTYSIYCVAPENGTVSLTTNKGSREDVTSAVLSATNGSEVTVSAVANPGYEFVAWRLNTPSDPAATCSTDATYTFDATSEIHIFAVFTNEYTVTYNGNGGAGAEMQGSVVNVNNERNQTFTLGECTYTAPYGKEFKGWAVGSVDAFPLNEAGDTIEIHADTTIYAIWDNRYIIVEQPENTSGKIGANVPVTVTIDISQVPNDSNDNIVLEVQNGGNWEQVAATTRSAWVSEFHSSTGSFNVTANTTGTKTYRYKVYDGTEWFTSDTFDVEFLPLVVTFVDNEHSTETDPISVDEYNTLITAPVIPTFAGDTFGGWNWPNWDFANDRVTQDITLSAQWKGRGYYGNIPDVYALVGAKARIDLSNVYSNNSYTYVYKYDGANWVQYVAVTNYTWYDLDASAVAKSETYKIVIRHSEDIESNEFTVNWVEDAFTVSFNNNGGDGTMDNVEAVGVYKLPECEFDAPASHRFVGWAIGSADTLPLKEVGDQITISANTVIYVVWEEIPEYMVAYNDNGGQGSMIGDLVEEGGEFTLDPCGFEAPDGKQFAGWAVGSVDALPLQQPGAKITITANTFIYAIWENIPPVSTYTVSFEANGGANSMADVEDVSGDYVLPANGFTAPNGKQFKCWSVDGEEKAVGATI